MQKKPVLGQDPLQWIRKTDDEGAAQRQRDAEEVGRYEAELECLSGQLESAREEHRREAERLRAEIEALRGDARPKPESSGDGDADDLSMREALARLMRAYLDLRGQAERRDSDYSEKVTAMVGILNRYKTRAEEADEENEGLRQRLAEIESERAALIRLCAGLKAQASGLITS